MLKKKKFQFKIKGRIDGEEKNNDIIDKTDEFFDLLMNFCKEEAHQIKIKNKTLENYQRKLKKLEHKTFNSLSNEKKNNENIIFEKNGSISSSEDDKYEDLEKKNSKKEKEFEFSSFEEKIFSKDFSLNDDGKKKSKKDVQQKRKNNKGKSVSDRLKQCLAYFGIKMNLDVDDREIWNISSVSENKLEKILKNNELEIINFHKKFFTRIYPKGNRFDSSNYDPYSGFLSGN